MGSEDGKFKKINVTSVKDIIEKKDIFIFESDLTLQFSDHIVQFEYEEGEDKPPKKTKIKEGIFSIIQTNQGIVLDPVKPRNVRLLDSVLNTKTIIEEHDSFFDNLDKYAKYEREPRRAILMYSFPGNGKTSTMNYLAHKYTDGKDHGTTVIYWDTSSVGSNAVADFFGSRAEFKDDIKKLLFIIEDIGGGTKENTYGGGKAVESSLLELLDGNSAKFLRKDGTMVPTFTMATTNSPEMLTTNLVQRPGRFDKIIELKGPNGDERVNILKFISKGEPISVEDETYIRSKNVDKLNLSIAHLQELFIRQKIYGASIQDILKDFEDHKKKCEAAFIEAKGKSSMGF